jgi:hypothetical protein
MKLNHKTTLFIYLALVSSFLFAGGVNNTKIPPTAIVQHICAEHSGDGGAVTSAGTCGHFGPELVVYDDEINSITNISTDYPDFPQSVTMSRDGETIYEFTNCGQQGRYGPNQAQINSAYTGTTLDGLVTINTQGVQEWTVPSNGIYTIQAIGASGAQQADKKFGTGATMIGEFDLLAGEVINIVVGQMGLSSVTYWEGCGGGGGSYVAKKTLNVPLVVASGGSGGDGSGNYENRQKPGGSSATGNPNIQGVTIDNNGNNNAGNNNLGGSAGGGLFSNGENGWQSTGGASYLNGSVGGTCSYGAAISHGGFGGGGGASYYTMGGAGGGYQGGSSQSGYSDSNGLTAALSYNSGTNPSNTSGTNQTSSSFQQHGQVVITSYAASNTAPTATAQSVTGNEDSPQTITLAGTDAEGDALTYALATNPSNGTWTLSGNVVTYTPNTNYNGSDSFTFTVSDAEYTSSPATVNISIAAVNDAPTATAQSVTGNEDSPQTITLAGTDAEGDDLTYALATNPSNGTSTLSGNVVTYTPNTNYNGSDSFTFTVSDGVSTSSPATVDISIAAVNDAPTAATQSVSGNEDAAQTITLAGSDVDGDGLTYALATNSSNGASTLSGNVVTYTPNTNYNGSDSFTFTVSDAEYTSSAATVSITVASVNDVPVILSTPALDALDGSLYEYSLSVSDVDLDVVAITATGPNWLTVNDNILSGTPSPSDGGLHQIVLSANDGNGGVVTQSYTLAVSLHSLVITGESGHRIFSSPVSGTIYGDLLDELWTQGAEGSDSPNSNPNIWTYGNGWNSVTDFSSDALTAGKGFLMYVFADTDFDGDDDLNDPENPVIISIDGAQQESGVSVVSEPSGWNLIGNPYGLSVDISQMLSDNNGTFNSTIYALDHTNPGYKTHNGVVGNIENDEIKPFDGFWIKADADGNVFEFTEQSIRKGSINAGRTTTDDSNGSAVFTFTNGDYSSSTYLSFTPEGQINLDPADAYRLVPMSPAEHLTSMIYESNKSLAINNLPFDLSTDISFPMDVMMLSPTDDGYATQTEQVDLIWDITDLPEGITLELTNNVTGQNINLTGDLSVIISLPSKGSFLTSGDFMGTYPAVGQSQFTLSVYGTLAAVEDDVLPERLTLHSAYPNPFNPSTLIRFDLSNADMVSLDIFDIAGKQVASLISEYMIPGSHQINWNPGNLSSGLYLVNLVVGTETFNQKITFIK